MEDNGNTKVDLELKRIFDHEFAISDISFNEIFMQQK